MRKLIMLLLLAALASGTFDQTYLQTLAGNGSSVITKTQDLSVFSNSVSFPALAQVCAAMSSVHCSVSGETMNITENFAPGGGYYTYTSDGGFPLITNTLVITKVPNDVFGNDLAKVLVAANLTSAGGSSSAIDLTADNGAVVSALRQFDVNLTYIVDLQTVPSAAYSGNVTGSISGDAVAFNLVDAMASGQPIVIKSQELNIGALALIIGVVVLAGLAYAFFVTSRTNEKPTRPLKRKKAE
jgi:hypothetical protein